MGERVKAVNETPLLIYDLAKLLAGVMERSEKG